MCLCFALAVLGNRWPESHRAGGLDEETLSVCEHREDLLEVKVTAKK